MKTISSLKLALLIGACALLSTQAGRATQTYQVTINTSSLSNAALSLNGPYALDFELAYGSGLTTNTATINNVSVTGGSLATSPILLTGTAAGNLSSSATLSTNSANPGTTPLNEITQNFTPGSTLTFRVTLTDNTTLDTPDLLSFALMENSTTASSVYQGYQIPTTQPGSGTDLVDFNIGGDNLGVYQQIYVNPYAGATDPVYGDYSGVTVTVQAVPEPSTWAVLSLGLSALVFIQMRRRRA